MGAQGRVSGQGVEQGAHPRLLGPDDGHGRVAVTEFRVGVDEGAAAPLSAHPRPQRVEDQQHPRLTISDAHPARLLGEPGQRVVAPAVGPLHELQRDERVLGTENLS